MDQDHRLAEELNRHSAHYRDKLFNVLVATLLRWNKNSFSGKFRDFVIVCNQPTLRLDAEGIRTRTSISIAIPNKLTLLDCESFEGPQYSFPCLGLWKMCSTRWEVNCIALHCKCLNQLMATKFCCWLFLYSIVRRPDSVEAPGEVAQ